MEHIPMITATPLMAKALNPTEWRRKKAYDLGRHDRDMIERDYEFVPPAFRKDYDAGWRTRDREILGQFLSDILWSY